MDENFEFSLQFEMPSNEEAPQLQNDSCENFLEQKSISEEVENALASAREVLLNSMEMNEMRSHETEPITTTGTETALSPLDEILKDIYELKQDMDNREQSVVSFQFNDSSQHTDNSSVNYFNTTANTSGYNCDQQTTFNSSGFDESNFLNESHIAQNLSQLYSAPLPIFPPIHQAPNNLHLPITSGPAVYYNYTSSFDERLLTYPPVATQPVYTHPVSYFQTQTNYYNAFPQLTSAATAPPSCTIGSAEGSAFHPVTPRYFSPKIVVSETVVSNVQPLSPKSIPMPTTQPKPIVQTPDIVFVKPPVSIKRPQQQQQEETILELEVSSYFDTSDIVIPILKERTNKSANRRKQQHKPISLNDDLIFEPVSKKSRHSDDLTDLPNAENPYSESELLEEVFKRKKRVSSQRKPVINNNKRVKNSNEIPKPEIVETNERDSYERDDNTTPIRKLVTESSSDTDSDPSEEDLPLTVIKSMKCPNCKKMFKTSNSLSSHRKRCTVVVKLARVNTDIETIKEDLIIPEKIEKDDVVTLTPSKVRGAKSGNKKANEVIKASASIEDAKTLRPKTRSQTKTKTEISPHKKSTVQTRKHGKLST